MKYLIAGGVLLIWVVTIYYTWMDGFIYGIHYAVDMLKASQ